MGNNITHNIHFLIYNVNNTQLHFLSNDNEYNCYFYRCFVRLKRV